MAHSKKIIQLAQAPDAKDGILKALGDQKDFQTLYDLVLVGTYVQPERRKSGLYMPKEAIQEDEFQGIVGLIVQMGPDAEKLAAETGGPTVGDWVIYNINNSWALSIRETPCRHVPYEKLRMRIADPKVIYDA